MGPMAVMRPSSASSHASSIRGTWAIAGPATWGTPGAWVPTKALARVISRRDMGRSLDRGFAQQERGFFHVVAEGGQERRTRGAVHHAVVTAQGHLHRVA